MRRSVSLIALLATVALALTLPLSTVAAQGALAVRVDLLPENEVPPADTEASGTAIVIVVPATDMVCAKLSWTGAPGTVTAAHIHGRAPVGVNASVVVGLTIDQKMHCVTDSDADLIAEDPELYYVNVHSNTFPGGFIRGQLG
jgi:hypothetical protein